MNRRIKSIIEHTLRAAGTGFCVAWQQAGLDYDTLVRVENLESAAVGAVLGLALSLGLLRVGDPQTATVTN